MPRVVVEEVEKTERDGSKHKYAAIPLVVDVTKLDVKSQSKLESLKHQYAAAGVYDQARNALLMPTNPAFSELEHIAITEVYQKALMQFSPFIFPPGINASELDWVMATGRGIVNVVREAGQGLKSGLKASGVKLANSFIQYVNARAEDDTARMQWVNQKFGEDCPYLIYLDPTGDGDPIIQRITPDKIPEYQRQLQAKSQALRPFDVPPMPASLVGAICYIIAEQSPHIALAVFTEGRFAAGCINAMGTFLTTEGSFGERVSMTILSRLVHNTSGRLLEPYFANPAVTTAKVVVGKLAAEVGRHAAVELAHDVVFGHDTYGLSLYPVIGAYGFAATSEFCPYESCLSREALSGRSVPSVVGPSYVLPPRKEDVRGRDETSRLVETSRVCTPIVFGHGGERSDKIKWSINLVGGSAQGLGIALTITTTISWPFVAIAATAWAIAAFVNSIFSKKEKRTQRGVENTQKDVASVEREHGSIVRNYGAIAGARDERDAQNGCRALKKQVEDLLGFIGEKRGILEERHKKDGWHGELVTRELAHKVFEYYDAVTNKLNALGKHLDLNLASREELLSIIGNLHGDERNVAALRLKYFGLQEAYPAYERKQYDAVKRICEATLRWCPNDPDLSLLQAQVTWQEGNYALVITEAQNILQRNREVFSAVALLVGSYQKLNRHADALSCIAEARTTFRDNAENLRLLEQFKEISAKASAGAAASSSRFPFGEPPGSATAAMKGLRM